MRCRVLVWRRMVRWCCCRRRRVLIVLRVGRWLNVWGRWIGRVVRLSVIVLLVLIFTVSSMLGRMLIRFLLGRCRRCVGVGVTSCFDDSFVW